jgi:S-adenosylhomocysteine hydrolase
MTTATLTTTDFKVADLGLHEFGRNEIRLAEHELPGLMATWAEFGSEQPLAGPRITGSLQMPVRTAVLIETLSYWVAKARTSGDERLRIRSPTGRDRSLEAAVGTERFVSRPPTDMCTGDIVEVVLVE